MIPIVRARLSRSFLADQLALVTLTAACLLWKAAPIPVPGYGRQVVETMVFEGLMAVVLIRGLALASGLGMGVACGVAYAAATAIDIDHIIVAGTFDFLKVMNTPTPVTHSLVFATALGLVGWLVTRRVVWGWILFSSVALHVLWDATDKPEPPLPLFWPFSWYQVRRAFGYFGVELLFLLNAGLASVWRREEMPERAIEGVDQAGGGDYKE